MGRSDFYMITGVLLLDSAHTVTIKKIFTYVLRMTMALLLFGIPFAMMEILFTNREISMECILMAVQYVLEGKSWSHLWYQYSIIGIYLILPLLRCFSDNCDQKTMRYVLVVLFVFTSCIPVISKILTLDIVFQIPMNSAVFYVLLGKYLDDYHGKLFPGWKRCVLLLIATSGAIVLITRLTLGYSSTFLSNSSPFIGLLAAVIFSLALQWGKSSPPILWHIDRLCFGVYLVHPFLINILYKVLKITQTVFRHYRMMTLVFFAYLRQSALQYHMVCV